MHMINRSYLFIQLLMQAHKYTGAVRDPTHTHTHTNFRCHMHWQVHTGVTENALKK
jgi:hypothetical protein